MKCIFIDMTDVQNVIDSIQPNTKVNKKTKNITVIIYIYFVLKFNILYFKFYILTIFCILNFLVSQYFLHYNLFYCRYDYRDAYKSFSEINGYKSCC